MAFRVLTLALAFVVPVGVIEIPETVVADAPALAFVNARFARLEPDVLSDVLLRLSMLPDVAVPLKFKAGALDDDTVKPPLNVDAVDVVAPLPVTVANVSASAVKVPLPVPAPIAVLNVAASSVDTELSALTLRKVTALGLVKVNRLDPTVVAPIPVRAVAASVPPVPPLASGSVPDTSLPSATVVLTLNVPFAPVDFTKPLVVRPEN